MIVLHAHLLIHLPSWRSSLCATPPCPVLHPLVIVNACRARVHGCNTEEELRDTPFETYDLYRGQVLGLNALSSLNVFGSNEGASTGTLRVVGKLKCIIRVTEGDPENELLFVQQKGGVSEKARADDKRILNELLKVSLFSAGAPPHAGKLCPVEVSHAPVLNRCWRTTNEP